MNFEYNLDFAIDWLALLKAYCLWLLLLSSVLLVVLLGIDDVLVDIIPVDVLDRVKEEF